MSLNLYSPGDLVLLLHEQPQLNVESRKLLLKYHGPFLILQKLNDLLCRVQIDEQGTQRIVYHDKMKPYQGDKSAWMKTALKKFQKFT